ncbi:DciA family protein [Ectothiorhodospira shaposhnikovii]|uniref:DciA family protein n=1 Tax=Ectothiorhodospira shaposhnikovii TaxID=1054 RepID=UPI00399FD399
MRRPRTLLAPELLHRARELENLTQSVRDLLPPGPREHCWVGGLEAGALILVTDTGAWASQLRYLQREILKQVKAHHGLQAKSVRIRVRPAMGSVRSESRARQLDPLSPRARSALLGAARAVDDPELSQALRRLAARSHGPVRP